MKLPALCIRRPVFATVINLIIVVLGFVGYQRLTVQEYPPIANPEVYISTDYSGASAQLMEDDITPTIEQAVSGVQGLSFMTSDSSDGNSSVHLRFQEDVDLEKALSDLRDKLSSVHNRLPKEADTPRISTANNQSEQMMWIAFRDDKHSIDWTSDYVERNVLDSFRQVNGVGNVGSFGGSSLAVRIEIDPEKMAVKNITLNEINQSLQANNKVMPGGKIRSAKQDYTVISVNKLKTIEDFKTLPLRKEGEYLITLQEVATVALAPKADSFEGRANGQRSIFISISAQADANPLHISRDIRKAFNDISPKLPPSMDAKILSDNALYIRASIDNVYHSIAEAVLLVTLIILLFLGALRSAFIPIVTIPLCLMGSFALIYFVGFSINVLTLLSLVLAIGLVVDDAIVVLENIHRHQEAGLSRLEAALKGSQEIGFAVLAMTITLAAVYLPVGLAGGITGQLMKEFSYTLAGAVLISGFVALTLTPMMCSKWLPTNSQENGYQKKLEGVFERLGARYQQLLEGMLRHRAKMGLFVLALIIGGGYLFTTLDSELAPNEDMGKIFSGLMLPQGVNSTYVNKQLKKIENVYEEVEEAQEGLVLSWEGGGFGFLILKPWSERERTQAEVINELNGKFFQIPGAQIFAGGQPALPVGGGGHNPSDLKVAIQITGEYANLYTLMESLKAKLEETPGFNNVSNSLSINSRQFPVKIDRAKAIELEVDPAAIAATIQSYLAGTTAGRFSAHGESYDIIIQGNAEFRSDIQHLNDIIIHNAQGKPIPLSTLITPGSEIVASNLLHYDRMRAAYLSASLDPGYSLGEAVGFLEDALAEWLPDNARYEWTEGTKQYLEASNEMLMTIALALAFIYLVLAAQFESFVDPFIILLTVPFSILGAVVALKLTGGTNNIYTQIGMLTLVGLISKHGILITEFANQLQREGMPKADAVIKAARLRLRPILMTTAAMIMGAIPLVLTSGAGAHARGQIAWVIIGGLAAGTLFSLLVVPLVYSTISRPKKALD